MYNCTYTYKFDATKNINNKCIVTYNNTLKKHGKISSIIFYDIITARGCSVAAAVNNVIYVNNIVYGCGVTEAPPGEQYKTT